MESCSAFVGSWHSWGSEGSGPGWDLDIRKFIESYCNGLNCMPPTSQFICWSRNPHWDGVWTWDLWEVTRIIWWWGPHDGISGFIRGKDGERLCSPPREECRVVVYQPWRKFLPRTNPVGTLILDFQPPSLSYSCLSCLGCSVLLWHTNLINSPMEGSTDGWEKSHPGVSWDGQADEESIQERFDWRIGCRRRGAGRAHPSSCY